MNVICYSKNILESSFIFKRNFPFKNPFGPHLCSLYTSICVFYFFIFRFNGKNDVRSFFASFCVARNLTRLPFFPVSLSAISLLLFPLWVYCNLQKSYMYICIYSYVHVYIFYLINNPVNILIIWELHEHM